MKRLVIRLTLALAVACSPKVITKTVIEHKTDTLVDTRIIHDSVAYAVPYIKEVNTTRDSTSHIENEFASSDASIEDGILHHSLQTKPHTIYVPYETIVRDTLVREVYKEKTESVTEKKKKTWWSRFKNELMTLMAVALLVETAYIGYRIYNKR